MNSVAVSALGFKSGPLDLMRRIGGAEVARVGQRLTRERPGMPLPRRPLDAYQNFDRHAARR